jgi:hypothetical protein
MSGGGSGSAIAIRWSEQLWLVEPTGEREHVVVGRLRATRARTWAAATVEVDEHLRYTHLLTIETEHGVHAPLKLAPHDGNTLAGLQGDAESWRPGRAEVPRAHEDHPWLSAEDAALRGWQVDGQLEFRGLCYPMFSAGTIVPFPIWGYYVLDPIPR